MTNDESDNDPHQVPDAFGSDELTPPIETIAPDPGQRFGPRPETAPVATENSPQSNLVAFRGREDPGFGGAMPVLSDELSAWENEEVAMPEMRRPNSKHPSAPVPIKQREEPFPEFAVMMRVGPNGAIKKNKGGTEELAGVVAYTARLVELVGDLLGLERFIAMECTFKPGVEAGTDGVVPGGGAAPRCLLFTEANGDTVAMRPRPNSNIQPLRESLGL